MHPPQAEVIPSIESVPAADCHDETSVIRRRLQVQNPKHESPRHKQLRSSIENLLEASWGRRIQIEKRLDHRIPFRKPITITPCDEHGSAIPCDRFSGFGVDISMTGMGFISRNLLSSRQAIVTCDGTDATPVHLLFEARWVRFTKGGWYQIGGQLIRSLEPPPLVQKI